MSFSCIQLSFSSYIFNVNLRSSKLKISIRYIIIFIQNANKDKLKINYIIDLSHVIY